jgi:BirA family biotin operon repressor/biotin-[acetyl-CoA-carboxylase] ligase
VIADLLPADIERELAAAGAVVGRPLSVLVSTASTNDDARAAAAAGAPHGATFVADTQTRGRGRGAHAWHSPPGENLYLSVVVRTAIEPARVARLALVAGVAVARAVERLAGVAAAIKWPNDVEVRGRKIAGVLVEGQIRGAVVDALVVGIGLNVGSRAFSAELADRATSLALEGAVVARARALAALLAELGAALAAFERGGLAPLLADVAARDALRDAPIRAGEALGVGAGIDAEGRLLVADREGRVHAIVSGSVERT